MREISTSARKLIEWLSINIDSSKAVGPFNDGELRALFVGETGTYVSHRDFCFAMRFLGYDEIEDEDGDISYKYRILDWCIGSKILAQDVIDKGEEIIEEVEDERTESE